MNQVITLLYVRSCGGARLTDGGHATYHASPHMSGQARTRMRTPPDYDELRWNRLKLERIIFLLRPVNS